MLAKAVSGHCEGDLYKETLAACIDAVARGVAVFPISDSIYIEVSKIGQYRQRQDLREAIEQVSQYRVVTSRSVVAKHEVESLLDRLAGANPQPINAMGYLDWGVARAFGMAGAFRIRSRESGEDVTDDVRSRHPGGPEAFDDAVAKADLGLNRDVIDGPSPEKEPELRKLGSDPTGSIAVAKRRAMQEIEQVARFDDDPTWRRGRIRDVVAAREVIIEVNNALSRGLPERGVPFQALVFQPEDARRELFSMPSFDVAVTLKTEYHRDASHRWTPNDIHDIDALGSTVPYCDIVVTDKAAASHVTRTGLAEGPQTTMLWRTSDLIQYL